MRRCSSIGSVALSGAMFALLAGCGHAISIPDWRTVGAAGSSNGGAGTGGSTSNTTVKLVKDITSETGTGGAPNTGACDSAVGMPYEATLPGATWQRNSEVDTLVNSMSAEAKYKQMYGVPDPSDRGSNAYGNIEQSLDVEDLSNGKVLRGLKYRDAGRGVCLDARQPNNRATDLQKYESFATAFPAQSARAASWDPDFEVKVGEALGDETMGSLNNNLLAPCMNILRHPYWGRSQETYGEDMYHMGRMASALTVGIQQHVIAIAKHYAANNVENGRQHQNANMTEQTLREVYVQHFAMVVQQGGVGGIMAAYNSLNSTKCTQNKHLLRDILKGPTSSNGLGFRGFVISDWWAMPGDDAHTTDISLATSQAIEAVNAGLDIEVPWSLHYAQLPSIVDQPGGVTMSQINDAVGRILEQKFRFGIAYPDNGKDPKSGPWGIGTAKTKLGGQYGDNIVDNESHLELAAESEVRSAVLVSNGTGGSPVLPISTMNSGMKIAVVGPDRQLNVAGSTNLQPGDDGVLKFATEANTGDRGSSRVNNDPAKSVGPYDGIKTAAGSHGITNVVSGNSPDAANGADFIVAVVGLHAGDEGEEYAVKHKGDRPGLDLPDSQNDFVNSVLNLNKPTVIIIEAGSIVNLPWLSHGNKQQATIWAGYPGQQGGVAFGKLLFGDRNFSGKMAVSWPQESDMKRLLPFRDPPDGQSVEMPYLHGYRLYDAHSDVKLIYPFGWGMSYTTFKYSNLQMPCGTAKKSDVIYVTADIENTGSVKGDEVMMLFVAGPPKPSNITGERPVKELKRFQRVNDIDAQGKDKSRFRVAFPLKIQDLQHWEGGADGKWVVDSGEYTIYVGPNADTTNSNTLQGKLKVEAD